MHRIFDEYPFGRRHDLSSVLFIHEGGSSRMTSSLVDEAYHL
jgi:hypothetical protein